MITAQIPTSDWVTVSSAGFDGILTPADDTVQECLQKLDDIVSSQIPVSTINFDGIILTSSENTVQKCVDKLASTLNSFVSQNGFVNRTDSSISFNSSTRTFTIQPTGASFEFYSYGSKYKKTTPQTIVIPNTVGLWYIYFDATGTLASTQTFVETLITKSGYVATVYWDNVSAESVLIGDERHGYEMDSQTHLYLHSSLGTQFGTPLGFALSGIVADGSGALDTQAQVAIAGGVIWDEDIKFTHSAKTTSGNMICLYLSGTGVWRKLSPSTFPLAYTPGGLAQWNRYQTGTWSLVNCSNGDFVLSHIFATNDASNPYIAFVGQSVYNTVTNARNGAKTELNNLILTGIPTQEFVPLATLIWETRNSYNNTPKSRIRTTDSGETYIDWRLANAASGLGGTVASWGNITGTLSSQADLSAALTGKQPLDGDLTAIAGLAGTSGFLKKTATDTWELATTATGWGTPTGTLNRAALSDGSSQTDFNRALMALITDLLSRGYLGA